MGQNVQNPYVGEGTSTYNLLWCSGARGATHRHSSTICDSPPHEVSASDSIRRKLKSAILNFTLHAQTSDGTHEARQTNWRLEDIGVTITSASRKHDMGKGSSHFLHISRKSSPFSGDNLGWSNCSSQRIANMRGFVIIISPRHCARFSRRKIRNLRKVTFTAPVLSALVNCSIPKTKGQIKQRKNFWTRRHRPQWLFSLGDCDRFSGMNATPGKPGALICLGNYATVIPTPIEGEGGGDKTKLSNSIFFCIDRCMVCKYLIFICLPMTWNDEEEYWSLRKHDCKNGILKWNSNT